MTDHIDRVILGGIASVILAVVAGLLYVAWQERDTVAEGLVGLVIIATGVAIVLAVLYCIGYIITDLPDDIRAWKED